MALTLTKSYLAYREDMGAAAPIIGMLTEKYGYSTIGGSFGGFTSAPFDFWPTSCGGLRASAWISEEYRKNGGSLRSPYPIL